MQQLIISVEMICNVLTVNHDRLAEEIALKQMKSVFYSLLILFSRLHFFSEERQAVVTA